MRLRLAASASLLSWPALALPPEACTPATLPGNTCTCRLEQLRPLQGAVGYEEVTAKVAKDLDHPEREGERLAADPIKVVQGPGGALFITDHHHGADAWLREGHKTGPCEVVALPSQSSGADFWAALKAAGLVHLEDAVGRPIGPTGLPADLLSLPDDPYRSLAWRLRKAGGFCRAEMGHVELAEFMWADWLRPRLTIPPGAAVADTRPFVAAALRLALSREAATMPGYVGDKQPGFECRDDDE